MKCKVKVEVSNAKQGVYDDLSARLGSKEGETDLYRQRDQDGKDTQQVRVIKFKR